jgi:DNA-binding NarL/FixJ family response regulator
VSQGATPSDQPIKHARILLADDHRGVRESLRRILSSEFEVVGAVADGASLLRAAAELCPDVIVVDVSMPEIDGLSVLRRLKSDGFAVKVILVSAVNESWLVNSALELGASGFVSKYFAYEELIPAVRAALDGRTYHSPSIKKKPSASPRP